MDKRDNQEEKNKRIGILTSVGTQILLLILFYFIVAWREPFPPLPEYGIELGFTTSAGATSGSSSAKVEQPQEIEVPQEAEPQENIQVETQDAIEEVEKQVESTIESHEAVTQKVENLPVIKEETSKSEEQVKEVKEPKLDERALMGGGEEGESDNEDGEGEENNEIDDRALYGSQGANAGSTEGASLSLAGWVWDFKPKPDDQSDQTGKIVYKIVVDQDGYLVKIETVTATVSPAVERKYRQAIEKLTFSKTTDYKTAPLSTGTITFIIKSK